VLIDISDFCGQWNIVKPKSGDQKTADISHCTPGQESGFAALNCEVEIPPGRHQLQFKGEQGSPLLFRVAEGGEVEIEAPNVGVMAVGGKGILKLELVKPDVDKGGFVGAGGFEYVAWYGHPDGGCNQGDRWAATPKGSTFMLTPTQALITSDRNGVFHSTKTTSVKAFPPHEKIRRLTYQTARILVYPDQGAKTEPWLIWESEASNNLVPGQREVVLIRDNGYEFRTSNLAIGFNVTAGCEVEPNTIRAGNSTFRLLAMCD
jgi:hypothetical protein